MRRSTASALLRGFLALQIAGTPFASARARDQIPTGMGSAMRATFGNWIAFTTSAPASKRCIVNNGPFWFQLFPDGHREFGVRFFPNEADLAANAVRENEPGILSARRVIGHSDVYRIRTLALPRDDTGKSPDENDVVIDDPRLKIEVQSSHDRVWKDPVSLIDFLKGEREVRIIFDAKLRYPEKRVDTARLKEAIDWCSGSFSK